jgi:hypothetical protein
VSTEYPRFSTNLTRLDISRLTPLLNSQTADTIWLEIHHELPELWKTPPHGDSSDEHEEITICLRGFISVTTHGYTTLKLSECLHKQPHGLSTNATVEIYGALWDRRSSSKSIWNHKDTHADFELISYSQADRDVVACERICPGAPPFLNAARLRSTSFAIYRPSEGARQNLEKVSQFQELHLSAPER